MNIQSFRVAIMLSIPIFYIHTKPTPQDGGLFTTTQPVKELVKTIIMYNQQRFNFIRQYDQKKLLDPILELHYRINELERERGITALIHQQNLLLYELCIQQKAPSPSSHATLHNLDRKIADLRDRIKSLIEPLQHKATQLSLELLQQLQPAHIEELREMGRRITDLCTTLRRINPCFTLEQEQKRLVELFL